MIGGDGYNQWVGKTLRTTDGGDSWHSIKLDPTYDDEVNKFLVLSETEAYAVGRRIYKYGYHPSPGLAEPEPEFDNSLCALSVERNPSNNKIVFRYTVPEDDNVMITIFVRGGRMYDQILDEHRPAGTYTIEFTAGDDIDDIPELHACIATGRYRQSVKFLNN